MDKKAFRNSILDALRSIHPADHAADSLGAVRRLMATPSYKHAGTIGVTVSKWPELDTAPLIEAAWKDGKQVAVPKCNPSDRSMQFRLIHSYDELETVYIDLQEPVEDITDPVDKDELDLVIVPGVVYSPAGYRIGFGGGYYDRYLEHFSGNKVSLAFEKQLVNQVPVAPHDIAVDRIFTDCRAIQCRGGQRVGDGL